MKTKTLSHIALGGVFLSILIIGAGALILNSEATADGGVVGLLASAAFKAWKG